MDGKSFMDANIYRYFEMKAQVENCISIDEVEKFIWQR